MVHFNVFGGSISSFFWGWTMALWLYHMTRFNDPRSTEWRHGQVAIATSPAAHESAPLRVPGVARSRCAWKYGIRYTIGISNISMYILKKSIFEWVNAVKWLRTYWMLEYWSILEPVFRQSFYDFLVLLWFDHRCYRPGSTQIPIWEPWWSQANLGTSWDIMAENLPPFFSSLLADLAGATPGDIMTCLDLILDQAGCADLCAICGMVALSTNMY